MLLMETSHSFLVAQDGNGGSLNVMKSIIYNLSANKEASGEYVSSFAEFVEYHHFTLNQIFNSDKQDSIFACYQIRYWLHP